MPAALEVEGLRFAYRAALREGRGVGSTSNGEAPFELRVPRFELAAGEQALLAGPSGGGKSTFLALIAGLLEPAGGSIRVAGEEITALHGAARDHFRGRRIGMIFQTFNLLPGFSALENVAMALLAAGAPPAEQRSRAAELLRELAIPRPGAPVEELSVGQQQRVAVARSIACRPALVLADEPTASLDPPAAAAAMDLIQRCCRESGAALLCTSHDPAMTSRFERVESIDGLARGAGPAAAGAGGDRGDAGSRAGGAR